MMIDGNVGNTEANVPLKKDCSLYHTGLKKGDVSNLIMIVGDPSRALLASKLLSNTKIINGRNYTTYSGEYSGKIGFANVDCFIREVCQINPKDDICVIRLGTCGSVNESGNIGKFAICNDGSCIITNNFNCDERMDKPYFISNVYKPDSRLCEALIQKCRDILENGKYFSSLNASTDSFYNTQGRIDNNFHDNNENILKVLKEKKIQTLDMETGMLYYLSYHSKEHRLKSAAIQIVVADREGNSFLTDEDQRGILDLIGSRIVLESLIMLK